MSWPVSTTPKQHDQRQCGGQWVVEPYQVLDAHQIAHPVLPDVEPDHHRDHADRADDDQRQPRPPWGRWLESRESMKRTSHTAKTPME